MVNIGKNGKSTKFNEQCKKVDSNKYYCEFEGKGDKKGQVAIRGSKDGDKEVMETSFEQLSKEEKQQLIQETKNRVSVSSPKPSDGPFDKPKE